MRTCPVTGGLYPECKITLIDEAELDFATSVEADLEAFRAAPPAEAEERAAAARRIAQKLLVQVDDLRHVGSKSTHNIQQAFSKAKKLTYEELNFHATQGSKPAEAVMLLVLAEVNFEMFAWDNVRPADYQKLVEILLDARKAAGEATSKTIEGYILLMLSLVYRRLESNLTCWKFGANTGRTVRALEEAIEIFDLVGDTIGGGKARHFLGDVRVMKNEFSEGILLLREAFERFHECEHEAYEIAELLTMAKHFLSKGRSREAVAYTTNAIEIIRECNQPRAERHLAEAVSVLVHAHLFSINVGAAQEVAAEWIDTFREMDDKRQLIVALMLLAEAYVSYTAWEEAEDTMLEALAMAESLGDDRLECDICLYLGEQQRERGKIHDGEANVRRALEHAQQAADRLREGNALGQLIIVLMDRCLVLGDHESIPDFLHYSEEQKALFEDIGYPSEAAHVLLGLTGMYASMSSLDHALSTAEKSHELFVQAQDKEGEARALSFVAELHSDLAQRLKGSDSEGRDRHLRAALEQVGSMRKCTQELGSEVGEARALAYNTSICLVHGMKDDALRSARDALKLAKKDSSPDDLFGFLILAIDAHLWHLTSLEVVTVRYADRYIKDALNLARVMRKKKFVGDALLRMSQLDCTLLKLEEALNCAREALDAFTEVDDQPARARAFSYMAFYHYRHSRPDEAMSAAQASLDIARQHPGMTDSGIAWKTALEVIHKIRGNVEGFDDMPPGAEQPQDAPAPTPPERPTSAFKFKGDLDPQITEDTIMDMARITLGTQDLAMDNCLEESGMDSLTAVSFRNSVQQNLGVKVSGELIYEFPTVRLIAQHIKGILG